MVGITEKTGEEAVEGEVIVAERAGERSAEGRRDRKERRDKEGGEWVHITRGRRRTGREEERGQGEMNAHMVGGGSRGKAEGEGEMEILVGLMKAKRGFRGARWQWCGRCTRCTSH